MYRHWKSGNYFLLLDGFRFWFYQWKALEQSVACEKGEAIFYTEFGQAYGFLKDFQITPWESPAFVPQLA